MFLRGLGTAHPASRYTKADCWEAFTHSAWFDRLDRRARTIAETVLLGNNGIEARYLALETLQEVFSIDPDTLHGRFVRHAPRLAAQAAEKALADAEMSVESIDGLVVSTCTGYLCPGLTSYVIEALGLRQDLPAFDLVGQGCGAALPNWQMCDAMVMSGKSRNVLSVCVEVSSAAMYLDNDPGVLVSACLFGDGAGAAVLSAEPCFGRRRVECKAAGSLMDPALRDALRFEQRDGMLRNVLTRPVPRLAAEHAERVLDQVLADTNLSRTSIATWIWHAGGRDVLRALKDRLGLEEQHVRYSETILREFGNLSSAFVYFVLEAALNEGADGGWWWMSSFGAGFSCHGALLEVA